VLLLAFAVLAATYSFVIPPWEATDEAYHFAYADFLLDQHRFPQSLDDASMFHYPPLYYVLLSPWIQGAPRGAVDHELVRNVEYRWGDPNSGGVHAYIHDWADEEFPYGPLSRALHLGRLFSVLCGCLALFGAIRLSREVIGDSWFALAPPVLFAFVPAFLVSSATIQPDVLVTAFGSLTLWRSVVLLRRPTGTNALWAAACCAAMLLTKGNAIAFLPPLALALVGASLKRSDDRRWVPAAVGVATLVLLAGPWMARNWALYGDPWGWGALLANPNGFPRRSGDVGIGAWLGELQTDWHPYSLFWKTMIFAFGYQDRYGPPPLYLIAFVIGAVGLLGLVVAYLRTRRSAGGLVVPLFLGVVVLVTTLAVTQVGFTFITGVHGRYLFPVLPALVIGVWVGLRSLVPRSLQASLLVLPLTLLLFAAAAPWAFIRPTYALAQRVEPPSSAEPKATFADRIELLSAAIAPSRASGGEDIRVRIEWEAARDVRESYRLFVHLQGPDGKRVAQEDRVPGRGGASTAIWRRGDQVYEDLSLTIPTNPAPGTYRLVSGFYRGSTMERIAATGSAAQPDGSALLGTLQVVGATAQRE
jgi:4-amino-4-deoxy-L-arabinose transferase-like glycosyltransferase